MKINLSYKNAFNIFGFCLALVGVFFVIERFQDYSSEIDFDQFGGGIWVYLGGLAFVYGFINILLAFSWRSVLQFCGSTVSRNWAVRVYGVTQISKYVPGNIFHLAGRQAIGMSDGINGRILAKSTVWELVLLIATGALFSIFLLPLAFGSMSLWLPIIIFTIVLFFSFQVAKFFFGLEISNAMQCHVLFLFFSGVIFIAVFSLVSAEEKIFEHGLLLLGGYTTAWLVGLVTPGSPAGLGVREFILLSLLSSTFNVSELLLAVVLSRLITASGDFLYFIVALYTKK